MKKSAFIIALFLILSLSSCYSSNQKLADKMIEKYSDNQNYVALTGEIVECDDNNVIIKCDELKIHISYEDNVCEYYIHSVQPLDLTEGTAVDFVTVPFHFYNGHKLPIVELKANECTLLSFEDGKRNLIDWVNTNFTTK